MGALERLAGDAGAFARDVWGVGPHLRRGDVGELVALLTLDDVDHLLTETGPRTPNLRLVRDGAVVPAREWTSAPALGAGRVTGLADVRRVLEHVDGGATLVLQGLQRWWPPVAELLDDLELEVGHACQANAYLTPSASQGFDWHADGHDVFVVQTHGSKRWHLRTIGVAGCDAEPDDDGELAIDLEPGHCLYLPRGTQHAPRALDGASLHVTIGVLATSWRHLVERQVRRALDDAGLDGALDVGWHTAPEPTAADLAEHLATVAERLSALDTAAEVRSEGERFLTRRRAGLRGGLLDRLAHEPLRDDEVVQRRSGQPPAVVDDGAHVRLLLPDRTVRIPGWVGDAVRAAVSRTQLRPADLAEWLDESSRLVLVRRLVREGAFQRV